MINLLWDTLCLIGMILNETWQLVSIIPKITFEDLLIPLIKAIIKEFGWAGLIFSILLVLAVLEKKIKAISTTIRILENIMTSIKHFFGIYN